MYSEDASSHSHLVVQKVSELRDEGMGRMLFPGVGSKTPASKTAEAKVSSRLTITDERERFPVFVTWQEI